jgi:hypothetical protein
VIISEVTSLSVRILPSVRGTDPFRMNPQVLDFRASGGLLTQKPPLRRCICEEGIYTLYLSISVNNNVELSTSSCFHAEDSTTAFRWLEASRQK